MDKYLATVTAGLSGAALGFLMSVGAQYVTRDITKPSASLEATLQDVDHDGKQETVVRAPYSCYVLTYDMQGQPHASYCPEEK